ncbi:MAG: gamma-glutamylcyclotransferase, partial [Bryobacteraceae bacterium]|nr:gamma-glutamylcyclotransferase [Bryobacteraceae bacterium]
HLTSSPPNEEAWREVIQAMQRRVQERFLTPVKELARFDEEDQLPYRPGFAILALDCLLIDTIQSFREGRVTTGDVSPAHSFKTFLSAERFADFTGNDRSEFFQYVRNGILHNGETRRNWKIRIDTARMLQRDPVTRTRTINRQQFHAAIEQEFQDLVALLESGDAEARWTFLRRVDAMSGVPAEALRNFYFAYGSNLKREECRRTAIQADDYCVALLPAFRLAFTKHSSTRRGDAATITPDPTSMVWGYVYRVSDCDRQELRKREGGYEERDTTVYITSPTPNDDPTPLTAFTFIAAKECPQRCGPPPTYLDLIIQGAEERGLPAAYQEALRAARKA